MEAHVVPGARFVDPKVLARIKDLELLARSVVDGFINGLHRAPYFGASIDFAEHRGYVAGDDIRRVDWRLYARTDKYFVKQYEADTNANFSVLLDISKSMGFASGGVSKLEYGEVPGGVPGVSLAPPARPRRHRDVRRGRRGATCRRRRSTSTCCCTRSIRRKAERPGRLLAMLSRDRRALQAPQHRRADLRSLREPGRSARRAASRTASLGNDLVVFHVLDPAEIDFPYNDASRFQDLESGEEMPVVPEVFAEQYRKMIRDHIEALRSKCSESRIDYVLLNTSKPLDEALFSYLGNRERLMRVR